MPSHVTLIIYMRQMMAIKWRIIAKWRIVMYYCSTGRMILETLSGQEHERILTRVLPDGTTGNTCELETQAIIPPWGILIVERNGHRQIGITPLAKYYELLESRILPQGSFMVWILQLFNFNEQFVATHLLIPTRLIILEIPPLVQIQARGENHYIFFKFGGVQRQLKIFCFEWFGKLAGWLHISLTSQLMVWGFGFVCISGEKIFLCRTTYDDPSTLLNFFAVTF